MTIKLKGILNIFIKVPLFVEGKYSDLILEYVGYNKPIQASYIKNP
jgi:hypothetical protein